MTRRSGDPEWAAAVTSEKDSVLVEISAELESEWEAQGLTVADLAHRARLSKRGLIYGRKTQVNPRLDTLVAQAMALGLRLVVRCE